MLPRQTHLHAHIHCSALPRAKTQTTQVSVGEWADDVVYTHKADLFHLLKGDPVISNNMDEPAQRSGPRRTIATRSHVLVTSEKSNSGTAEQGGTGEVLAEDKSQLDNRNEFKRSTL